MNPRTDRHVERLLQEGDTLVAAGRGQEASHRFSRVLLGDPENPRAREGEVLARALLAEEERQTALELQEFSSHVPRGGRGAADASPARVPPVLRSAGALEPDLRTVRDEAAPAAARAHQVERSPRLVLVLAWATGLLVVLGAFVSSFERIVAGLARAPRPVSAPAPPVTSLPEPTTAEAALAEARRLLAVGEAKSALRALDRIPAQDPNWPFARQIRAEAEAALGMTR